MSIVWKMDDLRIRWRTNYVGAFKASQEDEKDYLEYVAANDERCAEGDAGCIANPEPLAYQNYGSFLKHSLSASYTMALTDKSDLRVFARQDHYKLNL